MPDVLSEESLDFFRVIPMSVLSIFIATAYDILRFTAKTEIKDKLTLNLVTLSFACWFIRVHWSAEMGQIDLLYYTDGVQVDHLPGVLNETGSPKRFPFLKTNLVLNKYL